MKISVISIFATLFASIVPAICEDEFVYYVTDRGYRFTISYYDESLDLPFNVAYKVEGNDFFYQFGLVGHVEIMETLGVRYGIDYDPDGEIRSIFRLEDKRQLTENEEDGYEEAEDAISKQGSDRRLETTCTGCFSSWETLCEVGRPSVGNIISPEAPAAVKNGLTDDLKAGATVFNKVIKGACDTMGTSTVCDGCTCIPALQISLQPQDEGDIDLIVTEPSGTVVNFANRGGDFGFLDNDNLKGVGSDPENYLVTDGLTGSSMLGTYSVKVSRYNTPGDIFFKLKATVDGKKVWKKKYTLKDGDAESRTWTVNLDSYADNQCTSTAFNIIDEGDAPTKTPP